ncbi:MAG: energy-coupling factor transporter ATPase [Paenibacillaceae bacterium]
MEKLEVRNLYFAFPDEVSPAINGVSLQIAEGSFVLICGPTGCGKTTLLRHMKPELVPVGVREGQVLYQGIEMYGDHQSTRIPPGDIGMVMQHPDSQIVMENVRQELVFGLENLGFDTQTIRSRMAEMAHYFDMESWMDQQTDELSGGQKQLLNLASVLVLQPKVLLLDEPTAQLDPIAAKQFLQTVRRLNQELGMTVIMSEHRLNDAMPIADRVLIMNEGSIVFDGDSTEAANYMWREQQGQFQTYLPAPTKFFFALEKNALNGIVPLNVKDGRTWFDDWMGEHSQELLTHSSGTSNKIASSHTAQTPYSHIGNLLKTDHDQQPILRLSEVTFRYAADEPLVLNRLSLELRSNEWLALLGGNAAGKSTLLHMAAGLLKPLKGQVWLEGRKLSSISSKQLYRTIGFLPQNPMTYFVCDTVQEELNLAAKRVDGADAVQMVKQMTLKLSLEKLLNRHPHDLSGGEQQKLALACVLIGQPSILLLDEPTKGLDPEAKLQLAIILRTLHQEGLTLLMVTHDVEFAAATATRCSLLFDGEIASSGSPREFFSQNYFYTTSINRMVRHHLPEALTEEDVMGLWS